jgi:serine-type D-Ala-D-Ala carboxypeptidase
MQENIINDAVNLEISEGLFPGAVVAAGNLSETSFLKAYGHARVEPEFIPMQKNTIFDVASVTKVVAGATSLAICIEEGLVDINQQASYYLPGLQGRGTENILLRHLVTHTSGLKWSSILEEGEQGDIFEKILTMDVDFDTGTRFEYSNRNAILAGMIVESVTSQNLESFCKSQIFEPLAMKDTKFNPVSSNLNLAATRSEISGMSANVVARRAGRAMATVGLFSTASDLERICRLWLGRGKLQGVRLFSESTWQLATSNLSPLSDKPMGLFWFKHATPEKPTTMSDTAFGHSGFTGQSIWIDPHLGAYTIVLTNRNHPQYAPKNSPRGLEQYCARSRIADAALAVLSSKQSIINREK